MLLPLESGNTKITVENDGTVHMISNNNDYKQRMHENSSFECLNISAHFYSPDKVLYFPPTWTNNPHRRYAGPYSAGTRRIRSSNRVHFSI